MVVPEHHIVLCSGRDRRPGVHTHSWEVIPQISISIYDLGIYFSSRLSQAIVEAAARKQAVLGTSVPETQ